jgi:cobalt-zinc-cadmium efflux system protein
LYPTNFVLFSQSDRPMHHHSDNCTHPIVDSATKQRQLLGALLLVGSFAVAEWVAGQASHSLALQAEAGHMVSDCLSLGLALVATFLAKPYQKHGWVGEQKLALHDRHPLETWAALANGIGLVVLAGWIGWEAWAHWQQPGEIATGPMLITAIVGVGINAINIAILHRGSNHDLNLKGALLHVVADMASAIGVIIAAISVAIFHWLAADCVISFGIAGLILVSALPLVWESLGQLRRD